MDLELVILRNWIVLDHILTKDSSNNVFKDYKKRGYLK